MCNKCADIGVVNIYKEKGYTSHDVVAMVRKKFGIKKAGHTGTLDPQATGVLPVCLGKATKIADYITATDKSYRGQLVLGVTTDTQDMTGTVIERKPVAWDLEKIKEVAASYVGDILQTPPMYSAVKVKGQKLYELARKGIVIDRKDRPVHISRIEIVEAYPEENTLVVDVDCEKGVYIRTLFSDIGEDLGCGGCMGELERTRYGSFFAEDSVTLGELDESAVKRIEDILPLPRFGIQPEGIKRLLCGNPVPERICQSFPDLLEGELCFIMHEDRPAGIYEMVSIDGERFFRVRTMLL